MKHLLNGFILLSFILLSSCAAQKTVSPDLKSANAKLLELAAKLDEKAGDKLSEGNIDEGDAQLIKDKIEVIKQRATLRQNDINQAESFQKNVFTRIANNGNMRSVENRLVGSMNDLLKDAREYEIINQALDLSSLFHFEKTAFFSPGKYLVPYEIRTQAKEVFMPIVDTIIGFANRYPENKFSAKIVTFGYADETPTPVGSELYNDMCMRLKMDVLSPYQINSYISFLRAKDIADVISEALDENQDRIVAPENVQISILKEGRSTELPDGEKEYNEKDENRRVVKVYWNILPE
jgi:hypothetical protein